jgi:predicted enzyme related to lactoylglutathione lyase
MDVEYLFACIPVAEFTDSVTWYTRLFGRAPDTHVTTHEVMWQFTEKAFIYVLHDPEHAGGTVITLAVPDLDAALAELAGRGVTGSPVQPVGDAGRRSTYTDIDGNRIVVVQINQPEGG